MSSKCHYINDDESIYEEFTSLPKPIQKALKATQCNFCNKVWEMCTKNNKDIYYVIIFGRIIWWCWYRTPEERKKAQNNG